MGTSPGSQVWKWPDGSDAAYLNWDAGEPNNWEGRDERNAIMNCCGTWGQESSGKWYDAPDFYGDPRPLCRTDEAGAGATSSTTTGTNCRSDICTVRCPSPNLVAPIPRHRCRLDGTEI